MKTINCYVIFQYLLDLGKLKSSGTGSNRYRESEHQKIWSRFYVDEIEKAKDLKTFIEDNELIPKNFKPILNTIASLPCSIVECERGFSLMNNIFTNLRVSFLISNILN
jgi:hypothetical protein